MFEQVYGHKMDYFEEAKYSLPLFLKDGKKFYRVFVVAFS